MESHRPRRKPKAGAGRDLIWHPEAGYLNYKRNIQPLLAAELFEMTLLDKPNSRLQKYRITAKGRSLLS